MINKLNKRLRRGFSIVEVAVLVIIVGILGTAAIIPLTTFLTTETYEREEVQMQRAKRAVMGYAVRRRSTELNVILSGVTVAGIVTVPEGRPYLPCPDITGDGYEDRNFYDRTGNRMTVPIPTVTVTVALSGGTLTVTALTVSIGGNFQQDLRTVGSCSAMRGLLPWRTLGLPPTDTWGNKRTYAVDAAFSHKLVGFNESTLGDNFWQHGQITEQGRREAYPRRDTIRGRDYRNNETRNYAQPIGLCLGVTGYCSVSGSGVLNTAVVVAFGSYVRTPPTGAPVAYRKYQRGDLISGLPFIIVSHGKNGQGAANATHDQIMCRVTERTARHETANYPFVYNPYAGAVPMDFQCPYASYASVRDYSPQFFTTNHRNEEYDDVLIWATRDNLINALSNGTRDLAKDLPKFDTAL